VNEADGRSTTRLELMPSSSATPDQIAEGSEFASRLLLIRSLDDLKDRLAKVVLLILVVKFFEYALQLEIRTSLELLWLGLGVMLVAAALWLSHGKTAGH